MRALKLIAVAMNQRRDDSEHEIIHQLGRKLVQIGYLSLTVTAGGSEGEELNELNGIVSQLTIRSFLKGCSLTYRASAFVVVSMSRPSINTFNGNINLVIFAGKKFFDFTRPILVRSVSPVWLRPLI